MKKLFFVCLILIGTSKYGSAQVKTSVSGYVKNESGLALPGASVYLENTTLGATTNEEGFYTIENISPGSYNVIASFLGYNAQTQYNIELKSVGNPFCNFELTLASANLNEVLVTNRNKITRPRETPLSTQSLSAVEIASYPGSNNDVVQVAQSFPGISPSPGGFRNDLIIRGGAPNESVYYLDGIEVPNINHFSTQGSSGGPVGMLNVSFIEDVTLATSAFESRYENALSGVLQFRQRDGNRSVFHTNFRLSASEAALTNEGPLFKNKKEQSKTSYMFSVRRSYLQFLFRLIGLPIRPDYWDYQYKITHQIDQYNTLNLIGLGSIDDFAIDSGAVETDDEIASLEQSPFIEQQTNTIGISWRHRMKNGKGFMLTSLSNNLLINDFSRYQDNRNKSGLYFRNDSRESESKLRWGITYFLNEWKLQSGVNYQISNYKNNTLDINRNDLYQTKIDLTKYGAYANVTRSFLEERFNVSAGFRLDGDNFTIGNGFLSTFSPRFALSYELNDSWKLNASWGRYFKMPTYTILGYQENGIFVNKNADYTVSEHFVLGVEKILGPAANISLEAFYKKYSHYPVSVSDGVSLANKGGDFEVWGNEAVESIGKGRTYGFEFLFQQKLSSQFYGMLAYTFFYSEFTGFNTQNYIPSVWDSRHLFSFTGGYKMKKNWELSLRYRFAGKTPFAPINQQETLNRYPEMVMDYQRIGKEKLDVFSQLDLRIDKKYNFKKWSLEFFLDIQNLFSHQAPETPSYILKRDGEGNVAEPASLTRIETESAQPIPSLGIVIDF